MESSPSLHRSRGGGIFKGLLVILGAITLLVILALVGAGWYTKTQIDKAGGLQAFSGKMLTKGLEAVKPQIDQSLAPGDRQRLAEAIATIGKSTPGLTPEQFQDIALSLQGLTRKMQNGNLSDTDAKAFVDELTRLLHPPSDILDSESIPRTR